MEQLNQNREINDKLKPVTRSYFLTLLCILTFISSGLSVISYSVYTVNFDLLKAMVTANKIPMQLSWMKDSLQMLINAGIGFFLLSAIFNLSSVSGAYLMWKLKKVGFHVYTISQILLILTTMFYIYHQGLPWAEILGSGLFVGLYGTQIRFMH